MTRSTQRYLSRAARKTILYIVVSGLAMIILFPIFFLISFSFMSNYEAYSEWPNPLVPRFFVNFQARQIAGDANLRLTPESLDDLKASGVPQRVLDRLNVYIVTKLKLGDLKRHKIPEAVLDDLTPMLDQVFRTPESFLHTLETHIGRAVAAEYGALILERVKDFPAPFTKQFEDHDRFFAALDEYLGAEDRRAYQQNFLKYAEVRYMLRIYNHADEEYQPFGPEQFSLKTQDLQKLGEFFKRQTNCEVSVEQLQAELAKLDSQETVNFSLRKSLLANYIVFFQVTRNSGAAVLRSLYTAFSTIAISLVIGGMAGFAFARYRFKGKNWLKLSVLFVRMFPGVAIAIPMVIILGNMGLYDQPIGLSLAYSITQIALTIWITASIFMGIPVELEEAAQIFGATRFGAFRHVTLPLALPGLAACAMYAFIGAWNEAAQAIILTQFNPTFPVVIYEVLVVSSARGLVNLVTAGSVAQALPAVIFTLFIRKYIVHMWGGVRV